MRPRIKICGLTRAEDVACAAGLGADALGFVFAPGPRQLTPERARALVAGVPAWVNKVGVFGPHDHDRALAVASGCRLDTLQFHGPAAFEKLAGLRERTTVIQALGVGSDSPEALQQQIDALAPLVDAVLLDTARPGQLGGTGHAFDWRVLDALRSPVPLLVAGGLRADNVGGLLAGCCPWGLDLASGVESAPGIKDAQKLGDFFRAVERGVAR